MFFTSMEEINTHTRTLHEHFNDEEHYVNCCFTLIFVLLLLSYQGAHIYFLGLYVRGFVLSVPVAPAAAS